MKPGLRVIANRPVLDEVEAEDQQDRVLATADRLFAYMLFLLAALCLGVWWWLV